MQEKKNKFLYLLNLLTKGNFTKKEIIEAFKNNNIKITNSTITNYINLFKKNNLEIIEKTNKQREKTYTFKEKMPIITFTEEELRVLSDVKKLLRAQKDYIQIRKAIRLFYKVAQFISDEETRNIFTDFGYFSSINWGLIKQLEQHCKEKNLITINYSLPQEQRDITIHADKLIASNHSERLYLNGILKGATQFSSLPIDKINSIKKIEEKNKKFDIKINTATYVISKKAYEKAGKDAKEEIISKKKNKIAIQRTIDDDFYLIQRLLYFCPDIYYISDERIKKLLKEKLKNIQNTYDTSIDR